MRSTRSQASQPASAALEAESAVAHAEAGDRSAGRQPALTPEQWAGAVEAVLLSADKPLSAARLAEVVGISGAPGTAGEASANSAARTVRQIIEALNAQYEQTGRSFRIEAVAGGYRVMMLPQYGPVIAAFQGARQSQKLSRAGLETLAIIAYRQPITRADIETIRGVSCGEVLRTLLEAHLVTITGRAEELGRPMLYGTTRHFLEVFGLSSIKDLPSIAELPAPVDVPPQRSGTVAASGEVRASES